MFCSKCGKEIPDESIYCPYCGGELTKEIKENVEQQSQKIDNETESKLENKKIIKVSLKKAIIITLVFLLLMSVISVAIVFINKKSKNNIQNTNTNNKEINLEIDALNNKKETINLLVEEEKLTKQINDDLYKIKEAINGNNINVDRFVVNGLYNKKDNTFEFLNYIVECRDSYNPNGIYYHIFSYYNSLIIYGISNDTDMSRLVEDDVMKTITESMELLTNYGFKDDYLSIVITPKINTEIYEKLYNNANFLKFDIVAENYIQEEGLYNNQVDDEEVTANPDYEEMMSSQSNNNSSNNSNKNNGNSNNNSSSGVNSNDSSNSDNETPISLTIHSTNDTTSSENYRLDITVDVDTYDTNVWEKEAERLSATINGKTMKKSLEGGTISFSSDEKLSIGTNNFTITVTNNNGVKKTKNCTVTFEPPKPKIGCFVLDNRIDINITTEGLSELEVSTIKINGEVVASNTSSYTYYKEEGKNSCTIVVIDKYGQEVSKTVSF